MRYENLRTIRDFVDFYLPDALQINLDDVLPKDEERRAVHSKAVTDNGLEIQVELPGVAKEDVKVYLRDGLLYVASEDKKRNKKTKNSWTLYSELDYTQLVPKLENGILTVSVPYKKETKPFVGEFEVK